MTERGRRCRISSCMDLQMHLLHWCFSFSYGGILAILHRNNRGAQSRCSKPKYNGPGQDKQYWHDGKKKKRKTQARCMLTRLNTKDEHGCCVGVLNGGQSKSGYQFQPLMCLSTWFSPPGVDDYLYFVPTMSRGWKKTDIPNGKRHDATLPGIWEVGHKIWSATWFVFCLLNFATRSRTDVSSF